MHNIIDFIYKVQNVVGLCRISCSKIHRIPPQQENVLGIVLIYAAHLKFVISI